jgi:hypothetical protein
MKLNVKALALTSGILWGLTIFLATLWLIVFGYSGQFIRVLDHFYIGYSFSVAGAFIGLVWGFVDGLICGAIFGWLYNKLAG